MKEINELMDQGLGGNTSVWWILIVGLAIAFLYSLVKKIVMPALVKDHLRERWDQRLDFLEHIYWPAFVLVLGLKLTQSKPLIGLLSLLVLMAIFWHPLRNYFLGVLFRIGDTYKVGQRIVFEESKGVIKAFNKLSLELELDGGGSLDIPYSNFSVQNVIRISRTSGVLSHGIVLTLKKPCDLEMEKKRIKSHLLAIPYVLPDQKIVFEHLEEDNEQYSLKVIAHGLDQEQMYKVERSLKERFYNEDS